MNGNFSNLRPDVRSLLVKYGTWQTNAAALAARIVELERRIQELERAAKGPRKT